MGPGEAAPLQEWLDGLHARSWFDGAVSLGRADGSVIEAAAGVSSPQSASPFTVGTACDTGSVAKTITAALIHEMVREGRLALDDPVSRHLPAFPYADIAVDHLITHRTGLLAQHDWIWERAGRHRSLTNELILEVLAANRPPLSFPTGVRFAYDNVAFDMAALVVAAVADQPFAEVVNERVLLRHGLSDSFLRPAAFDEWPRPRTVGFRRANSAWELADQVEGEAFHGAANIEMSARDLRRWATALAESPATPADEVHLDDGHPTGINRRSLYTSRGGAAHHYPGVWAGYFALVVFDRRRGLSAGLVSNSSIPQWLRPRLVHELLAMAGGSEPTPPARLGPPAGGRPIGPDQAGTHRTGHNGFVELAVDEGQLTFQPEGGARYAVYPLGEDGLSYVPGLDAYLSWREGLEWWDGAGEWIEREEPPRG